MRNRLPAKEAALSEMDLDVRRRGKTPSMTPGGCQGRARRGGQALKEQQAARETVADELTGMDAKAKTAVLNLKEQLEATNAGSSSPYESSSASSAQGQTKLEQARSIRCGCRRCQGCGQGGRPACRRTRTACPRSTCLMAAWCRKKGLASMGVRTLMDLANMDAAAMRKASLVSMP